MLFCYVSEIFGILLVVCSTLASVVASIPECPFSVMKARCLDPFIPQRKLCSGQTIVNELDCCSRNRRINCVCPWGS